MVKERSKGTDVSRTLVERLKCSQVYRDFERAFEEASGLPLNFRPLGAFELPHRDQLRENPFCALIRSSRQACAACQQFQNKLESLATFRPTTLKCFAGFSVTAVPVSVGKSLAGFLRTGQVFANEPSKAEFAELVRGLADRSTAMDSEILDDAYFRTPIVAKLHYESFVVLLTIFAQHLGAISNALTLQGFRTESLPITQVKSFLRDHYADVVTLGDAAQAVKMTAFHFCRMFRKETGMRFTEYLARLRVERAKAFLLDLRRPISEVALSSGFKSLSQFGRVFRTVAGEAPSTYRKRMQEAMAPWPSARQLSAANGRQPVPEGNPPIQPSASRR